MGMGVATVFSFTFGYLIIISLNTGLAYEISRKRNKPEKIGIFYQRALIVNFLICAVTITPLLYISKKLIVFFDHID
jgi:Na+-driven multidrug efflux pump